MNSPTKARMAHERLRRIVEWVHDTLGGLSRAVGGAVGPVTIPALILRHPHRTQSHDRFHALFAPELLRALDPFVETLHPGFHIPRSDRPAVPPVFAVLHVRLVFFKVP